MYKDKEILALIPARGGSKGLPHKNIKLLLGKPLIAWTIEQARKNKYIDSVVVSTEDEEIAEISKKYGAQVPFIRPKELATDTAKGIAVVFHAMEAMENAGQMHDILIILQPTSPLRSLKDIDKSIELLFSKNAKAIISVCEVERHPYWENILPANRCMSDFIKKENLNKNRQEFDIFYRLNGAIFLVYWNYIQQQKSFFGKETFAYIMPKERSVDIDTRMDFTVAEILKKSGDEHGGK